MISLNDVLAAGLAYKWAATAATSVNQTRTSIDDQPGAKIGRCRTRTDGAGELALVCLEAGDGAPFLPREIYEALHFAPRYDTLPLVIAVDDMGELAEHTIGDAIIG